MLSHTNCIKDEENQSIFNSDCLSGSYSVVSSFFDQKPNFVCIFSLSGRERLRAWRRVGLHSPEQYRPDQGRLLTPQVGRAVGKPGLLIRSFSVYFLKPVQMILRRNVTTAYRLFSE